jgi:hypothetical protein
MEGPMDRLFGHSAFDFNNDGKIDAAEWAFINDTVFNDEDSSSSDYDDDLDDDLEAAGLDLDELEFMDEDERRSAIEDAGLDPDDFDSDFGDF